ncbi:c-Myc-binding protein-like isoform X2 [Sphaeramia orbicularis]|uniref:c-Myc-binding protein-like isoform X2 n=1 Tax=Sphaeramia orbicularis TaxID=375764 RepID=UPI0011815469|nr:c-Myc-binding protein-like isoform X2 [Sphaeramia orbicularis]
MAHHHRTSEPQKQQFRRYLEKAGVIQTLTNALLALNEEREKPDNALAFVKRYFDAPGETSADTEALQQEVSELRQKFARLVAENKELKTKVYDLQHV